ncbi:DUF1330 domain-containing protein [Limnohabitans sp. T6-20]|jgi:uncharacterized protein (DUF1330 family)|uniref:DUF1330 domain-containing protein n=1 Tax=Limnohabitans sp. T6-20 TaxID=1100725 RepID=UPI000D345E0B|nr:DUF1330 domain-containing protein [Limnohabitans sp. T6-20]PUE10477.1 hypothetical protein B9Z33_10495 [Limnohabitans sp. T6-20]
MSHAYVVGQMTVKNPEKWAQYRGQVLATLTPWRGELVFRGNQVKALSGECPHADIVVIRFPSLADADGWHSSPAYQALIALRQEAADVVLLTYEA